MGFPRRNDTGVSLAGCVSRQSHGHIFLEYTHYNLRNWATSSTDLSPSDYLVLTNSKKRLGGHDLAPNKCLMSSIGVNKLEKLWTKSFKLNGEYVKK